MIFGHFFEIAKNGFREIDLFDFTSFFGPDFFLNFWPTVIYDNKRPPMEPRIWICTPKRTSHMLGALQDEGGGDIGRMQLTSISE